MNKPVIAADIGGTHITVAIVHTQHWLIQDGSLIRNRVDSRADAKSILSAWSTPFNIAIRNNTDLSIPCIGIAMPGPFEYEKGISQMRNQDKYDSLYGMDIRREIAERIQVDGTHIRFINDAAAFLQGEIFAGEDHGSTKVLGITLGTGLGSAIWEEGSNAIDADLWKTPYLDSNMEEHLVTRWFVKKARQHGLNVTGLRELLQLRGKNAFVDDILAEYSHHLLHFIQFFSNREATDKFIIGGNISNAWAVFRSFDEKGFDRFDIRISRLGEHAALIGAAALFA